MSIKEAFYGKNSVMGIHSVGGRELSHVGGRGVVSGIAKGIRREGEREGNIGKERRMNQGMGMGKGIMVQSV
jgi:hypothetical protein